MNAAMPPQLRDACFSCSLTSNSLLWLLDCDSSSPIVGLCCGDSFSTRYQFAVHLPRMSSTCYSVSWRRSENFNCYLLANCLILVLKTNLSKQKNSEEARSPLISIENWGSYSRSEVAHRNLSNFVITVLKNRLVRMVLFDKNTHCFWLFWLWSEYTSAFAHAQHLSAQVQILAFSETLGTRRKKDSPYHDQYTGLSLAPKCAFGFRSCRFCRHCCWRVVVVGVVVIVGGFSWWWWWWTPLVVLVAAVVGGSSGGRCCCCCRCW